MNNSYKVVTVFAQSESGSNPCEIEYPTVQKYLDEGYYIKETFFASDKDTLSISLTFILVKQDKF